MKSIKILILEDNEQEAQLLSAALSSNYLIVGPAKDYDEGIQLIKTKQPDIAILDINIQGEPKGIDLANEISQKYPMPIIFLTSIMDRKTFKKAMVSKPYGYLLKPIIPAEIQFNIELALEKYADDIGQLTTKKESALKVNDNLFIKIGNQLIKISIKDIFYIESDDKYCFVFTKDKKFLVQRSLKSFNEILPEIFIGIHRKYLINRTCIESIHPSDYTLTLNNNKVLPVSQRYRKTLLQLINIIK